MHTLTNQEGPEAELRRSERRLSEVLENVSDGFFSLDDDWRLCAFNRSSEDAFMVDRERVLGRVIWEVVPELAGGDFEGRLRDVAETLEGDRFEVDCVGHARLCLAFTATPKLGGGVAVAFSDITARRRADVQQRLLVDELNHRVKNTLAVVQSLAVQSFRSQDSVEAAGKAFGARLATLTGAHQVLTDKNWQSASIGDVVEAAIAASADRARFTVAGPIVPLAPQTVVSFALALHELCVNATKHGALSTPEGCITIRWATSFDADGVERLHFSWRETGGPTTRPPTTRGFGSRLLERTCTGELCGSVALDFALEGLRCDIDVPVPMEF